MMSDYEMGTAFKDGYKLSRWFIVVILRRRENAVIDIDKKRPMPIENVSSSSLSTSIKNFIATALIPAYIPVKNDSEKRRKSNIIFSFYCFSSRYWIFTSFEPGSFFCSKMEGVDCISLPPSPSSLIIPLMNWICLFSLS